MRRDGLLLYAADRQHEAAQADLACHRQVVTDSLAGHQRDSEVNIATPALGPSFGIAPAGT